jgi:hypothetical protein
MAPPKELAVFVNGHASALDMDADAEKDEFVT